MIHTSDLTKRFKTYKKQEGILGTLKSFVRPVSEQKTAVENFDLNVERGEFLGLLGPNGAGKTTLMKMLTGIIVPTSGEVQVLGHTPFERPLAFRHKIALVMGQKSQLWWDIPAMDSFRLIQRYYEIPNDRFHKKLTDLSKLLEVGELLEIHVRRLSLGERMKLELMASLLHDPEILFLDEPTLGLDIMAQQNIREFLRNYQSENNLTVVLTSHYMADVEALCNRIVLILRGQKAFDGPLDSFERLLGRERFVTLFFGEPVDPNHHLWQNLHPDWSGDFKKVNLRLPEENFRNRLIAILTQFPVVNINSEKLPVERVMSTLLENPELLIHPAKQGGHGEQATD